MIQWDREQGFQRALAITFGNEGDWSDDPLDNGGRTKFGITEDEWFSFCRREAIAPINPINTLTRAQAEQVYRLDYWGKLNCSQFDREEVARELFDSGVNCGIGSAAYFAQRAYNLLRTDGSPALAEDGALGPRTVNALNILSLAYPDALLAALNGEQYNYYKTLVTNNPAQRHFIRGWVKRCIAKEAAR